MKDKILIKGKGILIVLLTAALCLRIYRINFNLPYLYYIDESSYIRLILTFFEKLSLIIREDFQHPHFYHYINSFIYGLFFLGGYVIKKFQNILDFQIFFTINFSLFLLISRYFSAIVGTANVILVYLIAKKIVNVRAGLIASAFLAFNYLHAQYSHLVCPRILETFFLSFAFLFILDIFYSGKYLSYILAGCVIGLAIGTEYTGFFIIAPFLLAHFLSDNNVKRNLLERCNDIKLYLGIFAVIAGFFIVSPYSLVNLKSFIYGIYVEFIKFRTGHISLRYLIANPFVYYWKVFLHNTGFIFLFLSLFGLIYCLYKRSRVLIVLISFPLTMICFLFSTHYVDNQYMLPVIPFLTVIIGLFLNFILEIFDKFKPLKAKIMKNGLYVLVCSSLLVSGLEVLRFGYYKSQKDARILAKEWLDDNVPANTKILTDIVVNSLPLESSNLNLQGGGSVNPPGLGAGGYLGKYVEYMEFLKNKNLDPYSEQFIKITRHLEQIKKYNVSEYDFPVNSKLTNVDSRGLIKPLSYYIDNGYKYVILGTFGILSKNTDPRCEPYRNFYAELESKGKLIKNFPQENLVFFQYHLFPTAEEVRIYKIGDK